VPPLVVRPAGDRFVTRTPGIQTRHCFSFGRHYDPEHIAHGRLVLHDEHMLAAGAGFDPHPHRGVEVVSWVLEGTLLHEHDGQTAQVPTGSLQRMSAGSGVVHAERAGAEPTRFVQLWLAVEPDTAPAYEQVGGAGELAEVLPGVHAGRLSGRWTVPDAARAHVYVATGGCTLDGMPLAEGDSVRLTAAGAQALTGDAQLLVVLLDD
jgi:redox-sensitive bicupin YhaK (pirin superfamily)